jgi:hypothetical protein
MKAWRPALVLAALLLCCGLPDRGAAGTRLNVPGGPSVVAWEPGESYEGKAQADPRLDRPVKFWRAGLTLAEVFDGVREQTGVEIRFWPSDDLNARMPVNLYLNPKEPPSLRSVMAQLMWAVDCPFCVGDELAAKTYYLVPTSMAGGAKENLQARTEAIRKAREGRWKEIGGMLDDYQQALDLPREELVGKYQGKSDLMLLNLLDPQRRAVTEFTCRHKSSIQRLVQAPPFPPESSGEPMAFGTSISGSNLTDEDIADLRLAFGLPESVLRDPQMMFDLHVEVVGRLSVDASPEYPQDVRWSNLEHQGPYLLADLTDDAALSAKDLLSLRRALGEKIAPSQEADYLKKLEQEVAATKRERERVRLAAGRSLSERARDLLARTSLTLENTDLRWPVTPWVAQEAVARATGMNVISDGLLWSGPYNTYGEPANGEERTATLTALAALDNFAHAPIAAGLHVPSWEWGDAGDFLRFRTADRDVWRAAMLPQEFLHWVNSLLQSHLQDREALAKQKRAQFTMPIGLVHMTRMLGKLSDLQMEFGAGINYGDPKEVANIAKHQVIGQITYGAMVRPRLTRFLASLTDAQWEQMKGNGLRCDYDLSPEQQEMLAAAVLRSGQAAGLTDRVVALDPEFDATDWYAVLVKAYEPGRNRRETERGHGPPYAHRVLRVHAVAPD